MDNSTFGLRLKELRKKVDLTQEGLADALNIKRTTLANYENKGTEPSIDALTKIANHFNVSLDYLTGRTNEYANTDYTDIKSILNINTNKPKYLRIKSPILPKEKKGLYVYTLGKNDHLEVFDPFVEREESGDERIYLKFANCGTQMDYDKESYNILQFMNQYGFLGRVTRIHYKGDQNLISTIEDANPDISYAMGLDQFFNDNMKHFIEGIEEIIKSEKVYRQISPDKDVMLNTYFETTYDVLPIMRKLRDLLAKLSSNPEVFYNEENIWGKDDIWAIEAINRELVDIAIKYEFVNGKLFQTFGYRSLLSLIYYELLFDLKSNIFPKLCSKCLSFFIPNTLDDTKNSSGNLICKKCTNHS